MYETIINKFVEAEVLIDDVAYQKIKNQDNSLKFAELLINELGLPREDMMILTGEIVDQYLKGNGHEQTENLSNNIESSMVDDEVENSATEAISENSPLTGDLSNTRIDSKSSPHNGGLSNTGIDLPEPEIDLPNTQIGSPIKEQDPLLKNKRMGSAIDLEILKDTSGKSYTNGEIRDLSTYFNSRFHKLKDMLKRKQDLKYSQPIQELENIQDTVNIIGMVNSVRNTKNNHKLIELEDETGSASVLIHNENHSLFEDAEMVVKDEVLGVVGTRKGSLVMASQLINPGIPRIDEKDMDFSIVFLSDTHIGSSTFLEDAFKRFIRWMNGDYGDSEQEKIANNVKYLVVAGDIVDGIGVYPNQDKELIIKDIYEQYEEAARLFGEINDVQIIITPGNHDAGRLAEPQPAIPEEFAGDLYKLKNTEFISNPSMISLDGINVLIYHGRGFDDLAMTVKGMSHQQTDIIMKELLEKRHLAPIYGERTPLASEVEDHLVIEEVPDVFHTGHVHINSYKKYKGIHLVNSGTFQSQTEFQKIYNIVPTCAQVPVLNQG
ncbi:MAG: DNA-directed DNA polymerase II small subunit, partial [Methanothermobacter sp.]